MARLLCRYLPSAITPIVTACYFTTDFSGLSSGASADAGPQPPDAGADADAAVTTDAPTADAPSGSYRDVVLADRPLAYWRLGDTGMVAKDEVGTSDGKYVGRAAHGPGIAGTDTAAIFDGATYIDLGDRFGFEDRTTFSVEAWITPTGTANETDCVIAKNDGPLNQNPMNGWAIYLDPPPNRGLNASRYRDSTEQGALSPAISAAKLTHFVVTYDGMRIAIWLDGQLAVEETGLTRSVVAVTSALTIGASRGGGGCRYRGTIDEVAIYGAPLAPARIEAHHQRGLTP